MTSIDVDAAELVLATSWSLHMKGNTSWDHMTEIQRRAVFEAGLTLHALQITERQISFSLTWVFPKDPTKRVAALFASDLKHQNLTLGQLVCELRKRADIRADFDTIFADFIAQRNRFVHNLFIEDACMLHSDAGASRAIEFMLPLQNMAVAVQDALLGHLMLWGKNSNDPDLKAFTQQQLQSSPRLQRIDQGDHENIVRRIPKA